ncbi:hypothetical protein [Mesorhizobium sp. M0520]|uniref:ABC transporter permease n=1 Tax=Mesorhizobium sp. M0520 TaxID=2956957 RepID=UPI00333987FD
MSPAASMRLPGLVAPGVDGLGEADFARLRAAVNKLGGVLQDEDRTFARRNARRGRGEMAGENAMFRSHAGWLLPPATAPRKTATRRRLAFGRAIPFGALIGPALLLVIWSIGSVAGLIDPRTLPAPWSVVGTAVDLIAEGKLQDHLMTSAWRAAQSLVFGILIGTMLALISGLSRLGEAITCNR